MCGDLFVFFAYERPWQQVRWLPWVEYCYNTVFHSATSTTPFAVVYGRPPDLSRDNTSLGAHRESSTADEEGS